MQALPAVSPPTLSQVYSTGHVYGRAPQLGARHLSAPSRIQKAPWKSSLIMCHGAHAGVASGVTDFAEPGVQQPHTAAVLPDRFQQHHCCSRPGLAGGPSTFMTGFISMGKAYQMNPYLLSYRPILPLVTDTTAVQENTSCF